MTARTASRLWSPFGIYYGWVIVGCAMVMNAASSWMSPFIFAFFMGPMGHELGWSRGEMSLAITFRLVTSGVVGPIMGPYIDRYGSRWIGAAAGIIAGGSLIALSYVDRLWLMYLIFTVSGLAGFGGPAGTLLSNVPAGKWFITKRGRAMAYATLGFPIGVIISVQIAQWIIDTAGWRQAWLVFGTAIIVVLVPVCARFMRRVPEDHGLLPDGAVAPPVSPDAAHRPSAEVPEVSWTRGQTFRNPTAWLILTATVMAGFALSGTSLHRVAFWQGLGISPTLVAIGTAADPFTVLFSAVAFGMVAERTPLRYLGLLGGLGFAISMLPMIFSTGHVLTLFLHSVLWGFFAGANISVMNLIWPTYFGRRSLGAIQGVVLPATVIFNGIAAPVYGYLFDLGVNPSYIWTMSMILFLISGSMLFFAKPPKLTAPAGDPLPAAR